jgi:hypothetical protein
MADNVREEIIVKRRNVLNTIVYAFAMISALFFAFLAAIYMNILFSSSQSNQLIPNIVIFVFLAGSALLLWLGKDYLRVEYEYSFTNGVVDIAQVINNRKRKELVSFKTKEAELVAGIEDPKLRNIESRPNIKKIKAVLNGDSEIYFACFRKNERQYILYFEPSKEFLKLMRMYNDRSVIL